MSIRVDYDADPSRGRTAAWPNLMSEQTWTHWLTFDGMRSAADVRIPTLLVHGDVCALPDNARRIHAALAGPKRLIWHEGFQTDWYERDDLVSLATAAAHEHFAQTLA